MLRLTATAFLFILAFGCQPIRNDYNAQRMDCGEDASLDVSYSRFLGSDGQPVESKDIAAFEMHDGHLGKELSLTRKACLNKTSETILVRGRDKNSRLAYIGPAILDQIVLTRDDESLTVQCDSEIAVSNTFIPKMTTAGHYGHQAFAIEMQTGSLKTPLLLKDGLKYFDVRTLNEGIADIQVKWQNLFSQVEQKVNCKLDVDRTPPVVKLDETAFLSLDQIKSLTNLQFISSESAEIHYCLIRQGMLASLVGTCDYARLKGDILTVPIEGEWILRYFGKDTAGNMSEPKVRSFSIFNTDRIETIKRIAQLSDLKTQTKEPLDAARFALEAHSLSDQLATQAERNSVDRLIRNSYWNVGLNLHVKNKIDIADPLHAVVTCNTRIAIYEYPGKLTVYDSRGRKLWSAAVPQGFSAPEKKMQWSHDCQTLATTFGPVTVWDGQGNPKSIPEIEGGPYVSEFSSDDQFLMIKGDESFSHSVYSIKDRTLAGGQSRFFGGKATFIPGTHEILVCSGSVILTAEPGAESVSLSTVFAFQIGDSLESIKIRNLYDSPTNTECKEIAAVNHDSILIVEEHELKYLQNEQLIATMSFDYRPRSLGRPWFFSLPPESEGDYPQIFLLEDDDSNWKDLKLIHCRINSAQCAEQLTARDFQPIGNKILTATPDSISFDNKKFEIESEIQRLLLTESAVVIDSSNQVLLMAQWTDFDLFEQSTIRSHPNDSMSNMNWGVSRDKSYLYISQRNDEGSFAKSASDLMAPIERFANPEGFYSYMMVQGSDRFYCAFALQPVHELRDCRTGTLVMTADRFIKGIDLMSFGALKGKELKVFSYQNIDNPLQTIDLHTYSKTPDIAVMHNYVVLCGTSCSLQALNRQSIVIPNSGRLSDLAFYDNFLLIPRPQKRLLQVATGQLTDLGDRPMLTEGYSLYSRSRPRDRFIQGDRNNLFVFNGLNLELKVSYLTKIIGSANKTLFNDYFTLLLSDAGTKERNEIHDLQNPDLTIRWPVAEIQDDHWAYGISGMDESAEGLLLFERDQVFKLDYDKEKLRKRLCDFVEDSLSKEDFHRLCQR